jgi:hypothetical protein
LVERHRAPPRAVCPRDDTRARVGGHI